MAVRCPLGCQQRLGPTPPALTWLARLGCPRPAPRPALGRSQLIENAWPGSQGGLVRHRMAIINLGANIDTRIRKMYEVTGAWG